ncbi:hypothetical protein J2Z65_004033 [Paenibacillus aceris]|uniref:Uncharacterized protein n=1 Tax=Paenibacillus aceris TaxID=869555 RepID=A0ABS4I1N3_9BACL|nr:hypothetical protein [Paenibacillus aceris]
MIRLKRKVVIVSLSFSTLLIMSTAYALLPMHQIAAPLDL